MYCLLSAEAEAEVVEEPEAAEAAVLPEAGSLAGVEPQAARLRAVSYTHLTLPTT